MVEERQKGGNAPDRLVGQRGRSRAMSSAVGQDGPLSPVALHQTARHQRLFSAGSMFLGSIEICCDNLCVGSCHRLLARPLIYLIFLPALQQHRLVLSLHLGRIDVSDDFVFVARGRAPIDAGRLYDLCSEFLVGDRLTNELS